MTIEDLRTPDGGIDARQLTDPTWTEQLHRVRPEECALWRRRLAGGATLSDLSDLTDGPRVEKTIRDHANGRCGCEHDTPAVTHSTGGGGGRWRFGGDA